MQPIFHRNYHRPPPWEFTHSSWREERGRCPWQPGQLFSLPLFLCLCLYLCLSLSLSFLYVYIRHGAAASTPTTCTRIPRGRFRCTVSFFLSLFCSGSLTSTVTHGRFRTSFRFGGFTGWGKLSLDRTWINLICFSYKLLGDGLEVFGTFN